MDYIPEDSLGTANQLLADELKVIFQEKRELLSSTTGKYYTEDSDVLNATVAETVRATSASASQLAFSNNGWEQGTEGSDDHTAETLYAEYKALQNANNAVAKSCSKLEQSLKSKRGGIVNDLNLSSTRPCSPLQCCSILKLKQWSIPDYDLTKHEERS